MDNTNKIWNINTGECENTLYGHQDYVISLKFLSNGQLASCSKDTTIKIWNYESGQCLQTLEGHQSEINTIEEGPNNTKSCLIFNIIFFLSYLNKI